MNKGMVGVVVQLVLLLISCSYASDDQQHMRRKSILSEPLLLNRVGSSVVFPIYGNVYPEGYYYVTLHIGQPPNPYFLDPDTGSDLTWLQCDFPCVHCTKAPHPLYRPTNDIVVCKDPLCVSMHSPDYHDCENPEQCEYEVGYTDGGSSNGILVKDVFPLNLTNGVPITPRLTLGCGYDQIPGSSHHPLDGVLGLGKGKSSIVSQLHNQGVIRNVVGHCLSGKGGGFLFFGDDVYDSSRVVWTSMSPSTDYSPGFAELILGGKPTEFKKLQVVFDSGSTYTYLNSMAYQALISWVERELSGSPLIKERNDKTLPLCWKDQEPIKNIGDVKKYFKPLALSFENGWKDKTQFELPPEAYLLISSEGNVCLGILNGTEAGLENVNIIGDISMQDKMVIYDNEKQVIGWVPAKCNRIPKFQVVVM